MGGSVKEQVTKLLELASKATSGKWDCQEGDYVGFLGQSFFSVVAEDAVIAPQRIELENASYIAACSPDVITALCERLQKYEEALEHIGSDGWVCGECMTPGKYKGMDEKQIAREALKEDEK